MVRKANKRNDNSIDQSDCNADQLLQNLPDTILIVDYDGTIAMVHGQYTDMFGYMQEELLGQPVAKLIPMRYRFDHTKHISTFIDKPHIRPMGGLVELSALRKDGSVFTVDIMLSPLETADGRFAVAVIRDATDRQKAKEELHRIAYFDPLTDLPNRQKMLDYLQTILESSGDGSSSPVSIATLEIEDFQKINDVIGYLNGDALLKAIADRLLAETPSGVELFRIGGDEFSVVVPHSNDIRIIDDIVRGMNRQLEVPFDINGRHIYITAHAGIAVSPQHGTEVDELIANASIALDGSKSDKSGNICLFDPTLRAKAHARRKLDEELRQAFENDEFELFFQPQICSTSCKTVGAEALLRWRHPTRGIVAPNLFIEALAEHPIAHEVGYWILHTAAEKAVRWHALGFSALRVGVNMFPVHFHNEALVTDVEKVLAETGLPASALELEITEDIVLNSSDNIVTSLNRLREMGVGIAFDDFGTGYASLSCLTAFPLSRIKIDRRFLRDVPGTGKNTAIVPALIALAHSLGLQIIAEGVETPEQLNYLVDHQCEEVQGFLFAKPMPEPEFVDFLNGVDADDGCASSRKAG